MACMARKRSALPQCPKAANLLQTAAWGTSNSQVERASVSDFPQGTMARVAFFKLQWFFHGTERENAKFSPTTARHLTLYPKEPHQDGYSPLNRHGTSREAVLKRTWILYKDFSRAHNIIPIYNPMSNLNMALLPCSCSCAGCLRPLLGRASKLHAVGET